MRSNKYFCSFRKYNVFIKVAATDMRNMCFVHKKDVISSFQVRIFCHER